jgi:3-deoxy-D-manno-octulosonic-acid transferase
MSLLYSILITCLAMVLSPILVSLAAVNRRGMRQRLGLQKLIRENDKRPLVWFHAASMGEVIGMAAVVDRFVQTYPHYQVFVTTMTTTGLAYAKQHIPDARDCHLLPLDVPIIMGRFFKRLNPIALILLEGELWPSLLAKASQYNCLTVLINARMSDRSYPRNRYVKPLFRAMLRRLVAIGVQSPLDGARYIEFGASSRQVVVTGNVKFDQAATTPLPDRRTIRSTLGFSEHDIVIMASCPRPVEEEKAVLQACQAILGEHPACKFIWSPRHLERIPDVEDMLTKVGLTYEFRSQRNSQIPLTASVLILDTMGELAALYAATDIAFVGATLVPLGGHNVLEPAACGIPVLFGPHTENVRTSAEALLRSGGGQVVQNGADLADAILRLIAEPDRRKEMGTAARAAVHAGNHALDRTMALLDERLFQDR